MSFKLIDPRENQADDPYERLSDDEFEIQRGMCFFLFLLKEVRTKRVILTRNLTGIVVTVKNRLEEIDIERKDLLNKLKVLEKNKNLKDPNFDFIEIPESPKKKSDIIKAQPVKTQQIAADQVVQEAKENENEGYLKKKQQQGGSTSYFLEKLQSVNFKEQEAIKKKNDILAHRIYTFDDGVFKEYVPIDVNEREDLSGLNIDRRYIPSTELQKNTKNIKVLRLQKLFSKVRPPQFMEPQYPNWLVIGIISKKTESKLTNSEKPVKFFSITLTDFQFELNVLFFGKAVVEKYYKLRVGDVVAILNPEILPSRKVESAGGSRSLSFSLKISKDINNILEIGRSKDLGFCDFYLKTKGTRCAIPINKVTSSYCEYHNEIKVRQGSAKRVEISSAVTMRAPVKSGYQQMVVKSQRNGGKSSLRYQQNPDRPATKEQTAAEANRFLFSSAHASTAFFDDDYENPEILANLDNKRRKIQELKNNRNLEKKLKTLTEKFLSKDEKVIDLESKKHATLSMFQHGLLNQIGYDPTKGKASAEIFGSTVDKKSTINEKQLAITDIRNIKKENVVLKPTRKQIREKFNKRNQVYENIMKDLDKNISGANEEEGESSDELEII